MTFNLPGGSLTETKHSTDWCRRVAQDNLVLLSEAGSNLFGTAVGETDQDLRGVCIEPPDVKLGLLQFEKYEFRSQPKDQQSGPGDVDLNIYGMAKWVKLLIKGSPQHLLLLFSPTESLEFRAWPGERLRSAKNLFVARSHGECFAGYLRQARRRLADKFDRKDAYEAAAIALHGIDLMQTGAITLPMTDDNRELLIKMRTGYTSTESLLMINCLEHMLSTSIKETPLQPWPRYDAISDMMADIYFTWWKERGLYE